MDDYYDILGVGRNASHAEIDRALRDQRRRWQQRTSSADLARRQDAERRLRQLGQARATLLDKAARRRYDRELAAAGPAEPPAAPERGRFGNLPEPVPPHEWVEERPEQTRYEPPAHRLGYPYGYGG